MECFDVTLGLHSLIAASLIIAGTKLMMNVNNVARGFGAYCFAFGYYILGMTASGNKIDVFTLMNKRYYIGLISVIAIVAGTFMMYYHVQDQVRKFLEPNVVGPKAREDIIKSIPIIYHILVYGGFLGLVITIALDSYDNINIIKALLAIGALSVIGYTKYKMLEAVVLGKNVQKSQIAHILSWGLLIIAISYSC